MLAELLKKYVKKWNELEDMEDKINHFIGMDVADFRYMKMGTIIDVNSEHGILVVEYWDKSDLEMAFITAEYLDRGEVKLVEKGKSMV